MSYNPNIPAASDELSQSQSEIQTNFNLIDSATQGFGLDHVQLQALTDQGKHKKSTYLEQSSDPTTAANEIAVYSKDDGSGNTRLYIRQESAGSVIPFSGRTPTVPAADSGSGETFLPGGFLLKWGNVAAVANAGAVVFPTAFPNYVLSVQVTLNIGSTVSPVGVNGFTTTGFTFRTTAAGSVPISYIALGY